jgi:acetyltransferase-like isoleucine patch superfamily enzyme
LGPVRIGDGAVLEPRCLVTRDVPAGGHVSFTEPKQVRSPVDSKHV